MLKFDSCAACDRGRPPGEARVELERPTGAMKHDLIRAGSSEREPSSPLSGDPRSPKLNWSTETERFFVLSMTKVISRGLVLLAGLVAVQGAADPDPRVPTVTVQTDPRLLRIKQFFLEHDCPAHVYAEDFLHAADQHNLDWRLLPSLSFVESSGGKDAHNNNMFGWDNCKQAFRSSREGIYRVASQLGRSKTYRNKSLGTILKLYNPREEYKTRVFAVMNELGPADLLPAGGV